MNISDQYREKEAEKPLHEQRWEEAKNRSLEAVVASKTKSTIPAAKKTDELRGKDLLVNPLVYYNVQDCLSNILHNPEWTDKAKKNIGIIKANREPKGQRLAIKADAKDVLGQYPEDKKMISLGIYENIKIHHFIREWCGHLVQIEIKEQDYAFGDKRRRGYMFSKASVIYYKANGIGLGMEQCLRINFWMFKNKPAEDR